MRIWLRRGDQIWGPYTWATVQRGLRIGRVSTDDLIRIGPTGQWQRLGDIVGAARPPAWTIAALASFGVLAAALAASWFIVAGSYSRVLSVHKQVVCQARLRQIYLACRVYRLDYAAAPRISASLPARLSQYLPATAEAWACPSTHRPYEVYQSGEILAADAAGKRPHPRGYAAVTRRGDTLMLEKLPPGGAAVNIDPSGEKSRGTRPDGLPNGPAKPK